MGWAKVGSGVARSQCRMAPSEPPETRRGCTGCHVTAEDKFSEHVECTRMEQHTADFLLVSL